MSDSCSACGGAGKRDCPACDGKGGFRESDASKSAETRGWESCARCGGRGRITCPRCNGSGEEESKDE